MNVRGGGDDGVGGPEEEPLGRPFLAWLPPRPADDPRPGPVPDGPEVRPYVITGGRTGGGAPAVGMETIVVAARSTTNWHPRVSFEKAAIVALCTAPLSVAEIAARQRLPLGVARVLVADLVADGVLSASFVSDRMADDVAFIERLIAGVAAL